MDYEIYFDGSPLKIVFRINEEVHIINTENNSKDPTQLEYPALIEALTLVPSYSKIIAYSDNQTIVAQMNSVHYEPTQEENPGYIETSKINQEKKFNLRVMWVPRDWNAVGFLI